MVHSSNTPHITRASHRTFFHLGEVNEHRRSFPYFSYSLVTSKQTPALHAYVQPAFAPVTKEGAQSNAPNAAAGHTAIYAVRSGVPQRHHIPSGWVCYRCHSSPTYMTTQITPHSLGSAGSPLPVLPAHHTRAAAILTIPLTLTPSSFPPIPSSSPRLPPSPSLPTHYTQSHYPSAHAHNSTKPIFQKFSHPLPQPHHHSPIPIFLLHPPHHLANKHKPSQN